MEVAVSARPDSAVQRRKAGVAEDEQITVQREHQLALFEEQDPAHHRALVGHGEESAQLESGIDGKHRPSRQKTAVPALSSAGYVV